MVLKQWKGRGWAQLHKGHSPVITTTRSKRSSKKKCRDDTQTGDTRRKKTKKDGKPNCNSPGHKHRSPVLFPDEHMKDTSDKDEETEEEKMKKKQPKRIKRE